MARYRYVWITGSGRCGTTLMRNLLDGHSRLFVIPGEVTNILGEVLRNNGHSTRLDVIDDLPYIRHHVLEAYAGLPLYQPVRALWSDLVADLKGSRVRLWELFDVLVSRLVALTRREEPAAVVIDLTSENIDGIFDEFEGAKAIHMIRHPLNLLNSHYRFRFADANSFGGAYPGLWEFGDAFSRARRAFRAAVKFQQSDHVRVVKLENLQHAPEDVVRGVLEFVGVDFEPICLRPTRLGTKTDSGSTYGAATAVFTQEDDWSCLTPNDLFYASQLSDARAFYDFPRAEHHPNRYRTFLARQFGWTGRQRVRARGPIRIAKVAIVSIAQYLADIQKKQVLQEDLGLSSLDDRPVW